MMKFRMIAAICAALGFWTAAPAAAAPVFNGVIPNIPGKSLNVGEVDYAPGQASAPHTHAKSAFIFAYVVSGMIELKVDDGPARIYRAGESWTEPPGAIHWICRNASTTEPAKLLAVDIVDTDDKPLMTLVK